MIKVNVSLIYSVKNKICWTLTDVIKLGVASKLVDKYGNSKSVIQCKNKIKALKDQYKKAKENNGKSGEEPESLPFYNQFDRILSERTIFTMPEFKEVRQKSIIASSKFSKSYQNNKEKNLANNTNDSKFFVFPKGALPKSDILDLLKGHPLCTELRV